MQDVTQLQGAMLRKIARSEFTGLNGAEPATLDDVGYVWANCIIEGAEDRGVFTSLVNAGLAEHSGGPKSDAGVTLTQAGFDAYKALPSATAAPQTTPTPWLVAVMTNGGITRRAIVNVDGETICSPSPLSEEEAALICAAPELLAAAIDLLRDLECAWRAGGMPEEHIKDMPYMRPIRAAIAKAGAR